MTDALGLILTPSPLHRLPRLSGLLGAELLIKRDDLLGRVLGGNKLRKLERILPAALADGADALVTTGSVESNHACLTVAAARMLGLHPAVVLMGARGRSGPTLNETIIRRLGAEVRLVEYDQNDPAQRQHLTRRVEQCVGELTDSLRSRGRRPWLVPPGGCCLEGSCAFVDAFDELHVQMGALGVSAYDVVLAVGTGSTFAGLWCGARRLGADVNVRGISIARRNPRCLEETALAASRVCHHLGLKAPTPEELEIHDEFVGEGYGKCTAWSARGVELALTAEGLLMDHTYTGKALGGLIELLSRRPTARPVVFWHTGGVSGSAGELLSGRAGPPG